MDMHQFLYFRIYFFLYRLLIRSFIITACYMYLLHLPNGIISGTIGIIGGIPVGRPPVAGIPGNVVVVGADTEG